MNNKINLLSKLKFLWKRQAVIVVTGEGRKTAVKVISDVLKQYFKIGTEILIFESRDEEVKKFEFFLKKSRKAVLIITRVGDISFDKDFFSGDKEKIKNTLELAKTLPSWINLILNFDDEAIREIDEITNLNTLTFGFQKEANFRVSDIKLNGGTNFKINYKGNVVPVWLEKSFGKEQIYSALVAIVAGTIFGLNLVKLSQTLKDYRSLQEGKTEIGKN